MGILNKIRLPLVEYRYKEGEWFWKALVPRPLGRKRKTQKPQLRCCSEIESVNKKEFDKVLNNAVRDIIRYLA